MSDSSFFDCDKLKCHKVMLYFSISPPLADVLDISQVAQNFGGSFMGVVQYNMDNTAFEVWGDRETMS